MTGDGRGRRLRRREAIALAGLLAGMASAAILDRIVAGPPGMHRAAI